MFIVANSALRIQKKIANNIQITIAGTYFTARLVTLTTQGVFRLNISMVYVSSAVKRDTDAADDDGTLSD